MPTSVIVNGARGKMGTLACHTINNNPRFKLVAELTRDDNLSQAIAETQAKIVIDLTRADSVFNNCLAIIESGAHPVIGTSGLTDEQIKTLNALSISQKIGGIIAPNFSLSAVLMMHFAAVAARYLPEVEIIEAHHQHKFDAPSGTAMKTAEMIAQGRQKAENSISTHELIQGVRGGEYHGVTIHSLRLPGVLAKQQVVFGNCGETLTISHNSIDRDSFMPGIILCCEKVQQLNSLHYGLESLLDLPEVYTHRT